MSDTPLFHNTDEQEAVYAPQQLPEGSSAKDAADVEARHTGSEESGTGAAVPSGETATAGGVSPTLGATALGTETEDEEDAADRPA